MSLTKLMCVYLQFPRGMSGPADPPMPDPFLGVIDDSSLGSMRRSMKNLAQARWCAGCGEKGEKLRRCKECRSVWYCSARCQKENWQQHWKACRLSVAAVCVAGAAAAAAAARRRVDAVRRVAAAVGVAGAAAAVAMLVHIPGSVVEAHSLSAGALNGARGRVVGTQDDRVQVDFGAGGRKALRPVNLRLLLVPPSDDAGG